MGSIGIIRGKNRVIISNRDLGSPGFDLYTNGTQLTFSATNYDLANGIGPDTANYWDVNTSISLGLWTHIAVVRTQDMLMLFVNGTETDNQDVSSLPSLDGSQLTIGNRNTVTPQGWNGKISSVHIAEESIYTADFCPSENIGTIESTIGLWNFGEGEGNISFEQSEGSLHAMLFGVTWNLEQPCLGESPEEPTEVNTCDNPILWYSDADGDGLGDESNSFESCTQPEGYVDVTGDLCPKI